MMIRSLREDIDDLKEEIADLENGMSNKRNYYVAITVNGGDAEGGPPFLYESDLYGPYTKEQAEKLATRDAEFPINTYGVQVVSALRVPIRDLKRIIERQLEDARNAGSEDEDDE